MKVIFIQYQKDQKHILKLHQLVITLLIKHIYKDIVLFILPSMNQKTITKFMPSKSQPKVIKNGLNHKKKILHQVAEEGQKQSDINININKMNHKSKKIHADHQTELKPTISQKSIRVDTFGSQIIKGQKTHRIAFKPHIQTIHVVENWKLYNIDHSDKEEESCPCQLI